MTNISRSAVYNFVKAAYFGDGAETYYGYRSATNSPHPEAYVSAYTRRFLHDFASRSSRLNILDLACGYGGAYVNFDDSRIYSYYGVDISPDLIQRHSLHIHHTPSLLWAILISGGRQRSCTITLFFPFWGYITSTPRKNYCGDAVAPFVNLCLRFRIQISTAMLVRHK